MHVGSEERWAMDREIFHPSMQGLHLLPVAASEKELALLFHTRH